VLASPELLAGEFHAPPAGQSATYNGASGFFFTAHIDSGNANTFWGSVKHILIDVLLGNTVYHHGC